MHRRTGSVGALLVAAALTLAACSSGGGSTHPSSSPTATASPTVSAQAGAAPTSSFCAAVKNSQAVYASAEATMVKAFSSGSFPKVQQELETFWSTAVQGLHQVEATMTSAPASVQSALTAVNTSYAQFLTAVQSSTSLQELETKMTAIGENAQLQQAIQTLKTYGDSQCGVTPSASP
jgi:hypothetical protein